MAKATVEAAYARALMEFAVSRGSDRRTLIERSGLSLNDLEDRDNRIPLASCTALMQAAIDLCKDPALGLRFGESVRTEDLSVVWQIAGAAKTVGEARATMNRYSRLLRDDGDRGSSLLDLVRDREGVWLEFKHGIYNNGPQFVEAGAAWFVCETRKMLATHHARRSFLKAVHFTHAEPSYRAEYDRVFDAPVVFGSNRNALLVEEDFLGLTMPPSNAYVSRVLSAHAEALLKRLENSTTTSGQVERLLISSLHGGGVSMDMIAARLGVTRQTLARKLKAEGTTFERALDELRHQMALHYLCEKRRIRSSSTQAVVKRATRYGPVGAGSARGMWCSVPGENRQKQYTGQTSA